MKKNTKVSRRKSVAIFAAAAMTAALLGGQVYPTAASDQTYEIEKSSLIPDNVTVEEPAALSEIDLPKSDYGTLSWVDESYVPDNRIQSCKVIFRPNGTVDLSYLPGWDAEEGVVKGRITLVVTSLEGIDEDYEYYYEEESYEEENSDLPQDLKNYTGKEDEASPEGNPAGETDTPETPAPDGTGETETPGEQAGTAETPGSSDPESSEAPETAGTPEGETTVPSETDEASDAEGAENETENTEQTPEVPDNIFDNPADFDAADTRPVTAEENLTPEEETLRAQENHSCDGIYVSGIELPWYVQFRVSSGENYSFRNEADAAIFQSYEFELWDLKNNTEYEIPDGQYISVTIPVKEGYTYTIEHLLDNGAIETIVPSVDGSTLVFSTHSFSPFGIAGNKPLVGGDIAENGYSETSTATPTPTPTPAAKATVTGKPVQNPAGTGSTGNSTVNTGSTGNMVISTSTGSGTAGNSQNVQASGNAVSNTSNADAQGSSSANAVKTADETPVFSFTILAAAAAFLAAAAGMLKKRRSN